MPKIETKIDLRTCTPQQKLDVLNFVADQMTLESTPEEMREEWQKRAVDAERLGLSEGDYKTPNRPPTTEMEKAWKRREEDNRKRIYA